MKAISLEGNHQVRGCPHVWAYEEANSGSSEITKGHTVGRVGNRRSGNWISLCTIFFQI